MTRTVRKRNLETSLYPLFCRKFEHNFHRKAVRMTKTAPAIAIHRGNLCPKKYVGKELDSETGLYYYGARYLDPRVSRWISGDPALGEYVPSAPVNEEARKRNGNLPGMGGVFNCVNLHAYHYAGNNPVRYSDPDGNRQTPAQVRFMRRYMELLDHSEFGRQLLIKNTDIIVTRNYYQGIELDGERYYKDNLSIRVFGQEINNIQVQSTVDWTSRYDASEASSLYGTFEAIIGVSGNTNELIRDTILFDADKGNFMHGPKADRERPFSGGCAVTLTKADEREVMNILRNKLGFRDGEIISWRFISSSSEPQDNL